MKNINDHFRLVRHRDNYLELMNLPVSDVVDELQDEFKNLNIHGLTETVLENNYPTVKITITNHGNKMSLYVVFDSDFGRYGIGVMGSYGLNGLKPEKTVIETKDRIKEKFREELVKWS